jgi:hypothetical protein
MRSAYLLNHPTYRNDKGSSACAYFPPQRFLARPFSVRWHRSAFVIAKKLVEPDRPLSRVWDQVFSKGEHEY